MSAFKQWVVVVCLLELTGSGLHAQSQRQGSKQQLQPILDNIFRVPPGVTLTDQQRERLHQLRQQEGPALAQRLAEIQQQLMAVYTAQQIEARKQAMREARQAGKSGVELRRAAEAAVQLTKEQRAQIVQLRRKQQQLLAPIRRQIAALVGRAGQRGRVPRIAPSFADVQYGPHPRNVLDFWQAKSQHSTPVLVAIHGGGFRGGNKHVDPALLRQCLDSGISVAAITYRLSQHAIAPASFLDSARAIQFIRSKAEQWNIDIKRLAATGGSAGAGLSLWLAFHDDLADPNSPDPVLRQSTRLSGAVVANAQTSYDPRFIRQLFPGTDTWQHPALAQLFGVDLREIDTLPVAKYKLFEEVSPINHLSKDDPPVLLIYSRAVDTPVTNQSIGIHHPKFGLVLKEKMDALGIGCEVVAAGTRVGGGQATTPIQFLKEVFGMKP